MTTQAEVDRRLLKKTACKPGRTISCRLSVWTNQIQRKIWTTTAWRSNKNRPCIVPRTWSSWQRSTSAAPRPCARSRRSCRASGLALRCKRSVSCTQVQRGHDNAQLRKSHTRKGACWYSGIAGSSAKPLHIASASRRTKSLRRRSQKTFRTCIRLCSSRWCSRSRALRRSATGWGGSGRRRSRSRTCFSVCSLLAWSVPTWTAGQGRLTAMRRRHCHAKSSTTMAAHRTWPQYSSTMVGTKQLSDFNTRRVSFHRITTPHRGCQLHKNSLSDNW